MGEASADTKPAVRLLIEYYSIIAWLVEPVDRSALLLPQVALLAMKPGQLQDPIERKNFSDLYRATVQLSRVRTDRKLDQLSDEASKVLVHLFAVLCRLKPTDEEIRRAGGGQFVKTLSSFRRAC